METEEAALEYTRKKWCPLAYEELCPFDGNINGHHYSCTGGWGDTIMCPPKQEMIRAFKAGVEFNRNENNNENN